MKPLVFSFLVLSGFCAFAQVEATTTDGKKVLLFPNGNYIYIEDQNKSQKTNPDSVVCESLVKLHEDKVTGKSFIASVNSIKAINKNGKFMIFDFIKSEVGTVVLNMVLSGGTCIEEDAEAYVLFTDGTRLKLKNETRYNCDGVYTIFLKIDPVKDPLSLIKQRAIEFRLKNLKTIRIVAKSEIFEFDVPKSESEKIKNSLYCLYK